MHSKTSGESYPGLRHTDTLKIAPPQKKQQKTTSKKHDNTHTCSRQLSRCYCIKTLREVPRRLLDDHFLRTELFLPAVLDNSGLKSESARNI